MTTRSVPPLDLPITGLAGAFATSGALHLVRPQIFEPLIPSALPAPRRVVEISGVAELACAAGLLHPRTRGAAGIASAALLVAILPGNVKMSLEAGKRAKRKHEPKSAAFFAGTLARLPLQWPMIRIALRAAGR